MDFLKCCFTFCAVTCNQTKNDENKEINMLSTVEDNDTEIPFLTLNNVKTSGKVVQVYDGDTCKIVIPFKHDLFKWNCRLTGLDTPELRTKNLKEKECGYYVRDKLRDKILNKVITVHCHEFDKYGRLLVTLYENPSDSKSINDWLIENHYAYKYDGGTKEIIDWDVVNLE